MCAELAGICWNCWKLVGDLLGIVGILWGYLLAICWVPKRPVDRRGKNASGKNVELCETFVKTWQWKECGGKNWKECGPTNPR